MPKKKLNRTKRRTRAVRFELSQVELMAPGASPGLETFIRALANILVRLDKAAEAASQYGIQETPNERGTTDAS